MFSNYHLASEDLRYGAIMVLKLETPFHCNYKEKSDKYIIQNILFCVPQKKQSHTWIYKGEQKKLNK